MTKDNGINHKDIGEACHVKRLCGAKTGDAFYGSDKLVNCEECLRIMKIIRSDKR